MPRTARSVSSSGYYDVVLRSAEGEKLFKDGHDCRAFIQAMRIASRDSGTGVAAYCLIRERARLLLYCPQKPPADFFKRLSVRYVPAFNRRHGRKGPLFRGRFLSTPLEDELALTMAVRDIHTEPGRAGLAPDEEYPYSSFAAYARREEAWVDNETLLQMMNGATGFMALMVSAAETASGADGDSEALGVIRSVSGLKDPTGIAKLGAARRNEVLCRIKRAGLSIRLIARLTGIGRNTIQRAGA